MSIRLVSAVGALALLGACSEPAPEPVANAAEAAPPGATPAPGNSAVRLPPADNELGEWLVGVWSFENSCATDFLVRYNADGSLDNSGELGTWSAKGVEVTEVITRRFTDGSEEAVKVDPPETRTYTVSRGDQNRGTLTLQRRTVSILRC